MPRRHRMTLATVIVGEHLPFRAPDGVAMNVATTRAITGHAAGPESRSHVPKSHIAHDTHEDDSQATKCLVNFLRFLCHRLRSHGNIVYQTCVIGQLPKSYGNFCRSLQESQSGNGMAFDHSP